jgi:hypothetical protein
MAGRSPSTNAPALRTMLSQIAANNRAGGWRKLRGQQGSPDP